MQNILSRKKIFVIIITYNGKTWIEKCIRSLFDSEIPVNIIVVDNGSNDGTQDIVRSHMEILFVQSATNLGFGQANNKGIQMAIDKDADYIFLLNQDAWIEKNTIKNLLKVSEKNPSFGVISPVHLNGSYTGLDYNFSQQLSPLLCPNFYSDLYVGKLKSLYEISFVNAAAWLISINCAKTTGLFEPLFFLYGEDNNYLQRVSFHGFKIGITPLCTICHDREIRNGSFNKKGIEIQERTYSLITLLNIQYRFSKVVAIFFKEQGTNFLRNIARKSISKTKYQIREIFFLFLNFKKVKRRRAAYKFSFYNYKNVDSSHKTQ